MKQTNLLKTFLLLCALVVGSTCAWADEATFDFTNIDGFSSWNTSYSEHSVTYADATVIFASANRQTSTITNQPVTKGQPVSIVMNDGFTISAVSFTCTQWGTKAQTITLHYSTDGGENYTSTGVTSTNFTISSSELPSGTNAVKITFSSTSNQVGIASASISYSSGGATTPSISADNVNITYDATGGSIAYTVNNAVDGGSVSAAIKTGDWVTLGSAATSPVSFTCAANTAATARTATVTLTYTYNTTETVTKDVTITQAGNPNIIDNISDITEVGTAYNVKGTVVATNARGFVIGDGTGYVYAYLNSAPTQSVNDKVSISGTTGSYGHIIQFTSSATIATTATSNYDGTPAATVITEVPDYSTGNHLSTYLEFEGTLTKTNSNYYITVGETQIQISYPTSAQEAALTDLVAKTVHAKGYFTGINSSSKFTVMLESVAEVVVPVITASNVSLDYDATSGEIPYTISNPTGATLSAATTADWISNITVLNDKVTFTTTANDGNADRTADITLTYTGANNKVVTVTQGHFVPDYATLPFTFDGGKNDIESTIGLTQSGLGSDYNSSPKLKFDGTDDYLILQINEVPGSLSFDIKGNNFSDGTFTVQTSADGVNYTDLKAYTELGATATESFALASTVRYIKWIYTEKVTGNVALGNISLVTDGVVPVTISAAGLATFASDSKLDFTNVENLEAYIAKEVSGAIMLTKVNKVPANTGILLRALNDATDFNVPVTTATADAVTGNLFKRGTGAAVATDAGEGKTNYVLGKHEGKVGFYKAGGMVVATNKAYLQTTIAAARIDVDFDETTSLTLVNSEKSTVNNEYYNLAGQRVAQPTKGLYIVNGRKVVIK